MNIIKVMNMIKPGWYVLVALLIYCLITTVGWQRSERTLRAFRDSVSSAAVSASGLLASEAVENSDDKVPLWFPIPGASLPKDTFLPGSSLPQSRRGVRQGFEFYGSSAGVPIVYGAPTVAATDAIVIRADEDFVELSEEAWRVLELELALRPPNEEERDALRGRQVWLRTDDGRTLRYAHLSATELSVGERVRQGEVVGYIGNSGTYDGVMNSTRGPRLGFEVWQNEHYFGQNLASTELRAAASNLFAGR